MLGKKRVLGGAIITVLSVAWPILDFLHGLPGRIENTSVWLSWLKHINMFPVSLDFIYPMGIVGGLAIATSEWWFPRITPAFRKITRYRGAVWSKEPITTDDTSKQLPSHEEVEAFYALRGRLDVLAHREPYFILDEEDASKIHPAYLLTRRDELRQLANLGIGPPSSSWSGLYWNKLAELSKQRVPGALEEARKFFPRDAEPMWDDNPKLTQAYEDMNERMRNAWKNDSGY